MRTMVDRPTFVSIGVRETMHALWSKAVRTLLIHDGLQYDIITVTDSKPIDARSWKLPSSIADTSEQTASSRLKTSSGHIHHVYAASTKVASILKDIEACSTSRGDSKLEVKVTPLREFISDHFGDAKQQQHQQAIAATSTEKRGPSVEVIRDIHAEGMQLASLGGMAALLKFPCTEYEEEESQEGTDNLKDEDESEDDVEGTESEDGDGDDDDSCPEKATGTASENQ